MREYYQFKIGDKDNPKHSWEDEEVFKTIHVSAARAKKEAITLSRIHNQPIRYNIRGLLQGHYVNPEEA